MKNIITVYPQFNRDLNGLVRKNDITVNAQMSSRSSTSSDPSSLFDETKNYEVCTDIIENSYFTFFFLNYFIIPTNYTFTVNSEWEDDANFPINWKIDGLFKDEWFNIGNEENCNLKIDKKKTFNISNKHSNIINQLKFTMEGTSTASKYRFCLHKADFFGTFIHENYISSYLQNIFKNKQKIIFQQNDLMALISVFLTIK